LKSNLNEKYNFVPRKHINITVAVVLTCIILLISYNFTENSQDKIIACDTPINSNLQISTLKIHTQKKTYTIEAEIANSTEERRVGLMCRESMEHFSGMLFVYDKEQYLSIWMKNTFFPLDIIFINENMTIDSIIKNATPLNTDNKYSSKNEVMYVLELNSGLSDEMSLSVGDSMGF